MVVVFPAPFGPEETEELSARDYEVQIVDGYQVFVTLG